jgi:hypothetical protein
MKQAGRFTRRERKKRNAQVPLPGLEKGKQILLAHFFHPEPGTPLLQDFRRGPVVQATVDFASSADATPFHVGKLGPAHSDRDSPVPVFLFHFPERKRPAGIQSQAGPLLDQEHIPTGLGQQACGDGASRSGPDNGNLTVAGIRGRTRHGWIPSRYSKRATMIRLSKKRT